MYLLYIDDSKKIHIGCAMGGEQKVGQVCVDMCIRAFKLCHSIPKIIAQGANDRQYQIYLAKWFSFSCKLPISLSILKKRSQITP